MLPDPNTAEAAGWLMLALAGLASATLRVWQLVEKVRGRPTGGEVAADVAQRYVTRTEFHRLESEVRKDISQMRAAMDEDTDHLKDALHDMQQQLQVAITRSRDELAKALFDRMNQIQGEVASVRADLARLDERTHRRSG